MNSKRILFFSILFVFLGIFLGQVGQAKASQVDPPIIIEAGEKKYNTELNQPYIIGLTPVNTEVLVYIDGSYVGLANINREGTKTDNFYYKHPAILSEGEHIIKVISQDRTSLVLSLPVEVEFIASSLPSPTLIAPDKRTVTGKVKPLITGLTVSNSLVRIYIDGVYNGKTEILEHDSGTANFAYQPFLNLNVGWHEAYAVAEDRQGNKSKISAVLSFRIEEPMPAPILFTPVVNNKTSSDCPFIVGLAKNDSTIKVYLDEEFIGRFQAENHNLGTANFAYRAPQGLTRGQHLVYTTAIDKRGKESSWSNIVYFNTREPAITQSAQETKIEAVAEIKEPIFEVKESAPVISPQEGVVREKAGEEKEEITEDDIKELIGEDLEEEEAGTGIIDESRAGQSKLNLNLIIFIAFLLGIIVWIFWVNKELIKERRTQQNKEEDEKNIDKVPENPDQNQDKLL